MKKYFILLIIVGFSAVFAQPKGTIKGTVIDNVTLEPLPGVNIILSGTNIGAASGINGEFEISNIDVGNYRLKASAIGYQSAVKTDVIVSSAKPAYVEFKLAEQIIELGDVTVTSDFFESTPTEINSVKSFSYEEIRRAPGGFEDVVRALSVLPGVAQAEAGRNDLVVRGGAPSENLYIIDGFVVPNINHFGSQGATGGALSYVNLDFVNETTFSSGGFSSIYGDKLSSVLTIDLRDGRDDRIGGKATVAATQFGLNVEGPISEKSNFLFSARRSYLDFIFNAAGFGFVPEYYDVLSKFTHNFDSRNRISYLFIGAFDRVNFNNDTEDNVIDNSRVLGSNQNQYLAGVSFRHLHSKGFYTIKLSRNFVDYDSFQKDTLFNPIFQNKSREGENELRGDVVYKLSKTSELNFGVSGKLIKFSADVRLPIFVTTFGDTLRVNSLNASEYFSKSAGYLQYSNLLFNRLKVSLGGRLDYFGKIEKKFYASPRFAVGYHLNDKTVISFSTGIYYQNPSYIWLIADEQNTNLKAVRADHYIAGIERRLRDDTRLKIEGFYKDYKNYPASTLRTYLLLANTGAGYGGADDNFNAFGLEPLTSDGTGEVKGVELSIQKKSSRIPHYGLASLTYSQSTFVPINGVESPGQYDQKWIFNLSVGYIFNQKWETSLKFRYATGNPYTPYNSDGTQNVSEYLSARIEPNHSLDLRVDRRWNFKSWNLIAYLDVQNVYNRKNSSSVRWDFKENKVDESSSIGLLPSIGISIEF